MTPSPRGSHLWGFSFVPRGAQPIALAQPYDCGIDCGKALRDCGNGLREFIAGKQYWGMMAAHSDGKCLRKPVMCFGPIWVLTLSPPYTQ